jgi:hypothetical protein
MGSSTSSIVLWDSLIKKQSSELIRCKESSIVGPETNKEYMIKHLQRDNCYFATCEEEESYQVALIKCPKLANLRSAAFLAQKLTTIRSPLVDRVLDYFPFKGPGFKKLRLAVVMHSKLMVSVEDWAYTSKNCVQLEAVLAGFFEGLEMLKTLHNYGRELCVISTQNVVICKEQGKLTYQIRFLTEALEPEQYPPEVFIMTAEADIWAAGLLLFTLLTGISPKESKLRQLDEADRLIYIRQCLNDFALTELVTMCCSDLVNRKSAEEILTSYNVRWWTSPNSVDLRLELLQALNTQLKFSSIKKRRSAVKAIFTLATLNSATVFSFVQLHEVDWTMITSSFIEAKLNFVALEGALTLFSLAIKHSQGARRLMLRSGVTANLLNRWSSVEFSPLIAFFSELCLKATSSVPVLLYERNIHLEAFKNYSICLHSKNFLLNSAPYFGKHAVKIILLAYTRKIWSCNEAIELLLKVPFQNLLLQKQSILELIETCVESLNCLQFNFSSSLDNALKLLSSITCILDVFEHTTQRGSCLSSPEIAFSLELTRCPLVIFCGDCAIPVCVFCGATCHKACNLRPLCPQSVYKSCTCLEYHSGDREQYPIFNIKKQTAYTFVTTSLTQVETVDSDTYKVSCSGFTGEAVEVTSLESLFPACKLDKSRATAFYFEVKVMSTGERDALSIGVKGLEYQSWNGQIVDADSKLIRRAPSYGSHDTVGMGMTHDSQAYFTYNGLMMHPLLPLPSGILSIKFMSEHASVLLLLNTARCLFHPRVASHMIDLRLRAAQRIPRSLMTKIEKLLLENYNSIQEERKLDDLLVFISSQFSGQLGRSVLDRANLSSEGRTPKRKHFCLIC